MNKVLVLDTSVLCCLLGVPGKETCGSGRQRIDKAVVEKRLNNAEEEGATFVLPLATIIETGNHIAHAPNQRFEKANELGDIMKKVADSDSPWAAFSHQSELWSEEGLKKLAESWPKRAAGKVSIGDATITEVADYYARTGWEVSIFSGDAQLSGYVPKVHVSTPRRRGGRVF